MGVKDIITEAQKAAKEIKKLGDEILKLTKDLEGLEEGTADYEKVNAQLQTQMNKMSAKVNQNTKDHKNSQNAIDAEIKSLRTLQGTLDRNSIEYAKASKKIREHQQSLNKNSAATGLASTSAMEFGRVISDAPYGIRGMANNVSQLTSLLFQGAGQISATTGKVIGLKGAIQGMWGAMMGPLGIMIAIQGVIALIDGFAGSTEKAAESSDDFRQSIESLTDTLKNLNVAQNDVNGKIEDFIALQKLQEGLSDDLDKRKERINDIKEEVEQLRELAEYQRKLTQSRVEAGDSEEFISGARKAYAETLTRIWELEGQTVEITKEATNKQKQYNKSKEDFNSAKEGTIKFLKDEISAQEKLLEVTVPTSEAFKTLSLEIIETKKALDAIISPTENKLQSGRLEVLQEELKVLKQNQLELSQTKEQYAAWADGVIAKQKEIDDFMSKKDEKKDDPVANVKDFKLSQGKINSALTKSLREQELLLAKSNAEKLRLKNDYAIEDLLTTRELEKKKDAARLDAYLNSKASPKQKAEARELFDAEELLKKDAHEEALIQLGYNAFLKENKLMEETKQAFSEQSIEKEIEREQNRLATLEEYLGNDPKSLAILEEQQRLIWEKEDENFEINLERRRTELFALYEDESQVQQIIDEERADRDRVRAEGEIQLERDKADAKMAIQLEYINYVKGLGQVLSILGKKNEGLAIAGLAVEKGAAIASIVVKAQASNAKASAASLEFASLTAAANAPLGPAGAGLTASMIAANEASTAAQRAKTNINAGLSIAKIAATTLTSSALGGSSSSGSSGGGGGGGSTTFTPNFNVVGNSGANQLAEGISNQVNEPTRAYVVYEDIAEAGSVVEESIESSGI